MATSEDVVELKDDEKEKLHQLIVDGLQFADVEEDCLCSSCHIVPIFHHVYPCQHRYCRDCYTFFKSTKKKCSKCKMDITSQSSQKKLHEYDIYNLLAICPNEIHGCPKTIALNKLVPHLEECQFKENMLEINHCTADDPIGLKHLVSSMQKTLEIVELERRKSIEQNERICESINNLEAKLDSIKEDLAELKESNLSVSQDSFQSSAAQIEDWKRGKYRLELRNYQWKKKEKATIYSDPFSSSEGYYKMRLRLIFDFDCLRMHIEFLPGEFDRFLTPGFYHRTTFNILDQSNQFNKRNITRLDEPIFATDALAWMKKDKGTIVTYKVLEDENKDWYVLNDTIYVEVLVEPIQHVLVNYFSRDGTLIWNLENYNRAKQESLTGITDKYINSQTFYTTTQGYRVQAFLEFKTAAKFIFDVRFLIGECDNLLPATYAFFFNFILVNQGDTSGKNDKPLHVILKRLNQVDYNCTTKANISVPVEYGVELIEKEDFIVDDRVVLKVTAQKQ